MRARNIKPSIFKNEILGSSDPLLTILFQGLWCAADREGRLEDRPLRLKAEILPYRESADINLMLDWLASNSFIKRYACNDRRIIQVIKFKEHQRPHANEIPTVLHAFVEGESACNLGDKLFTPREQALRSDSGFLIPDSPSLIPELRAALPHSGIDPRKQIFDLGKLILGDSSGGLISKAIKATSEAVVGAVLGEMALSPKVDPRAYFSAAVKPKVRGFVV